MSVKTQSELTKILSDSFHDLGANLLKAQNQFVLVDYLTLGKATANANGTIQIGNSQYSSLVFPKGITLPASVSAILEQAKNKGLKIVYASDYTENPSPDQLAELIGTEEKFIPTNTSIAFGKYTRDGQEIYMMTNTGDQNYTSKFNVPNGKRYVELDPQTGKISDELTLANRLISVSLAPLQTRLFIIRK